MHFRPGGQKVEVRTEKSKKFEKIENFRFFEIDPKVKKWTYGRQFWPKNHFFLAGAYSGRAPGTGETTYAFSAGYQKVAYICSLSNGSLRLA